MTRSEKYSGRASKQEEERYITKKTNCTDTVIQSVTENYE